MNTYAISLKAPSLRIKRVWGLGGCWQRVAIHRCMKKEGYLFLGDQLLVRTRGGLLPKIGELVGWKPALEHGYRLVTIETVGTSGVDPMLIMREKARRGREQ